MTEAQIVAHYETLATEILSQSGAPKLTPYQKGCFPIMLRRGLTYSLVGNDYLNKYRQELLIGP